MEFVLIGLILYTLSWILAPLLTAPINNAYPFKITEKSVRILINLIFAVIWGIAYVIYLRNVTYSDKTGGRHYASDHARYKRTYKELIEYYQNSDPYRINPESLPRLDWRQANGVILGKVGDRLVYRPSASPGNIAVFSLPGGGKTTSQIIPTALRFGGGCLVIDIKGDILRYTHNHRHIRIFNPENPKKSCHFNPFYGIEAMNLTDRRTLIEQLASIIVPAETDSSGRYFTDGARDFYCGIALYLLHENIHTTFMTIIDNILHGDAFEWVTKVREGECSEAQDYLNSYYGTNERNVAGCYQNLSKNVRRLRSGGLAALLDDNGTVITPATLEHGYDVYIEIPQDKIKLYSGITTIIVTVFMMAFMQRADSSSGKKRRPIIFLLDEMVQLHLDFDMLSAGLATLRSKGVTFFMAMQSIAQLQKRYGNEGCREIIDNCAYISIMSAQDPQSRQYFQSLIGSRKVLKISNSDSSKLSSRNIQETREPIFQPEDFGNLQNDDKVVICANGKYIVADKTYCYK